MITIDTGRMTVKVGKAKRKRVTVGGLAVLLTLARRPGRVCSRDDALDGLHGADAGYFGDRSIDSHVKRLRKIVGGKAILSVYGVGYLWSDEVPVRIAHLAGTEPSGSDAGMLP